MKKEDVDRLKQIEADLKAIDTEGHAIQDQKTGGIIRGPERKKLRASLEKEKKGIMAKYQAQSRPENS